MSSDRPVIVVATGNAGKLREVRQVLGGLPVDLRALADFPPVEAPDEAGDTFEANASLKALFYARHTGCIALADDSGLEVDALGGRPGIHSAHFAGPQRDDRANNALLVQQLAGVPEARRTARFRCAVAIASADRVIGVVCGTVEGRIIDEPRGTNGFGYDPHFFVPEFGMTTAEMPPEQKNAVSHRGRALRAAIPMLQDLRPQQREPAAAPDLE